MKPVWKWVIGIVGALLLIIAGIAWYLGRNWKPLVETKLKEVIHNSTDGLYTLKYDDLDLNAALGNVTLTNAELIPDSAVYKKMVETKDAPNNRFHIKLNSLKIRRVGIMSILRNKKLHVNSINLESPQIHMINEFHAFNDTIKTKESKSLYDNIKDVLNAVSIKDIKVNNVNFKYSKIENGKSSELQLDSLQIAVNDVLIDETSINDSTRIFYTKMVEVNVPGFEYDLPNDFYRVKFDGLRINTREKNVLLTNVSYAPKMSKSAFFKQKNQNITMAVLNFDTLRLEQLDFKQLIDNQKTIARRVQVKNGSVSLYNDKRYPKKKISKIGRSPHQQLMKMQQVISVDTVFVDNVDVLYGEYSAKFNQEGIITFNKATGIMTNVTNDTIRLQKDKFMRADLRAKIMNSGNLHAKFGFDMLSKNGAHTYNGTLGGMNATAFNKILKPLLNVEIASGNIKHIAFNMQGTDHKNWGSFNFDYNNLKISLLNEKDGKGKQDSKKLLSFVVNQILINDSNPDANEKYHVGRINYTRVPEHTFFKTLWQSLLDGIKQCAGISPEREARLVGSATKAQSTVEETKSTVQKTGGFIKRIFKKKEKKDE